VDGESETRNEFSIQVWREKQYMPYALVVGGGKNPSHQRYQLPQLYKCKQRVKPRYPDHHKPKLRVHKYKWHVRYKIYRLSLFGDGADPASLFSMASLHQLASLRIYVEALLRLPTAGHRAEHLLPGI
jgi:hypothetical protein